MRFLTVKLLISRQLLLRGGGTSRRNSLFLYLCLFGLGLGLGLPEMVVHMFFRA